MIAISAQKIDYSEPIPIEHAVNDPPMVDEPDEKEESSGFAELLAGLLQNAEAGLDDLAVEKSQDGNKLNIFANAIETDTSIESFTDIDISDAAIDNEYQNILSAEHLFNSSLDDDTGEDFDIAQELDAKTLRQLADLSAKRDTSSDSQKVDNLKADNLNDPASQLLASLDANARKSVEEALTSNESRKKRIGGEQSSAEALSKNEKTDNLSVKIKAGEENAAILNKQNDNPTRLEEMRNRIRKDKVSMEVRDMRTPVMPNNAERAFALVETAASRVNVNAPVQEVTLELRLPDYGQSSQAQTSWEAKANTALENMLARELHQNFNGDIVRHASMALRNNGEGLIKLSLKPDVLGDVKIRLELSENKITGHIVVESEEALNAFRREIASLEQAFKDSGFAEASLNLSLSADGAGADNQELEQGSFSQQMAASNYEAGFEQGTASIVDVFFGQRESAVNMLA